MTTEGANDRQSAEPQQDIPGLTPEESKKAAELIQVRHY